MKIPQSTKDRLLNSEILYIRYNAALLFGGKADPSLLEQDDFVRENLAAVRTWNDTPIERHDKSDLNLHRLALLADLGVTKDFPGMDEVIAKILTHVSPDGILLVLIKIPTVFGGSGEASYDWVMTNFPTVLYSLLKMGVRNSVTAKALERLASLVDTDGYRCVGSIPKFKGPGSKTSICPYANLIAAKAMSEDPDAMKSPAAKLALDSVLRHWDEQGQKKYFLFGVGTDYKKLKFPFVWYNILHTLDTASRYPEYRGDKRVKEMAELVMSKADGEMQFKPESVYMAYKGRDFADKKQASPTLTLFTLRILMRLGMAE
ncbi:MAG: hypothetical protein A2Y33_11720 [Spirochaetes bacterium GWF1_51_8]|nr:MAG: hypothetical protein A2Y33_11720 [Spirochaetes bacterium GWF1_51_8]